MRITSISLKNVFDKIGRSSFLLPYIQRDFVWKKDQITFLLDSMMRDYPIGTFLFWITDDKIYARKFSENKFKGKFKKNDYVFKSFNENGKFIVLDGQQRIQSLYIALIGEYEESELYFNLSSSESDMQEHKDGKILYQFKFFNKREEIPEGFVKTKELFDSLKNVKNINRKVYDVDLLKGVNNWKFLQDSVDKDDLDYNLKTFLDKLIKYNLEYIPLEDNQNQDEILEIFIRTNYGGTKLTYSDLIFSYLKNYWSSAEEEFKKLISDIDEGKNGFSIDYQFVIKTCITLIDKKCEFNLSKINKEFVSSIRKNWRKISKSIKEAFDILRKIYLFNSKYIKSNISIIPIIYSIYSQKTSDNNFKNEVRNYIYTSTLKNIFSSKPETTVDSIIKQIESDGKFRSKRILQKIVGVNLSIVEDDIMSKRARRNVKLILNLIYYNQQDYLAKKFASSNNLDVDHIYPISHCEKYYKEDKTSYDNLLNYCYLSNKRNRVEKLTVPPLQYFDEKEYKFHLLDKKTLFEYKFHKDKNYINNFEKFKEFRKRVILEKINSVLSEKN